MSQPRVVMSHHHVTSCVGEAQEDLAFHTALLGLKSVKKTLLYDGKTPIYHLYYGNDLAEEGTLLTTFPMRHTGQRARRGAGQFSSHDISVPVSSLDWWHRRLSAAGVEVTPSERFGERRLRFPHPGGIVYDLVGVGDDDRSPSTSGDVPPELGIRGSFGITLPVTFLEDQAQFMVEGFGFDEIARDGSYVRYAVGGQGAGHIVDVQVVPGERPGTWTFGEGSVHHCAFQVPDHKAQSDLKFHLEGMGFTDVSDVKDRGYFDSVYVRSPSGALFEATVSKSMTVDEPIEALGTSIMLPPQLEGSREEILAQIAPLVF